MRWPDGFLWGTGASSTQCEGAAPASDWWEWERAGLAMVALDRVLRSFAPLVAEADRPAVGSGTAQRPSPMEPPDPAVPATSR